MFLALFLQGCQDVIEVKLKDSDYQLVVEANISDQPIPASVHLTTTLRYDAKNEFPPATGATVILKDDLGNSATLTETQPGWYESSAIIGTPGRTYTLGITFKGKSYLSTCAMPYPATFGFSYTEDNVFSGIKSVSFSFADPAGVKNYYHPIEYINGERERTIYALTDDLLDGTDIIFFFYGAEESLESGDTVVNQFQTIAEGPYQYFRTLSEIAGGQGGGETAPANPRSNISNGALGYFNAYSLHVDTLIVP